MNRILIQSRISNS